MYHETVISVCFRKQLFAVFHSLYTGQLHWTLITRKLFYEVVIVSMLVGNVYLPVDCKELNKERSIIDSGTTNLRFPKTVFDLVVKEIKVGEFDVIRFNIIICELLFMLLISLFAIISS